MGVVLAKGTIGTAECCQIPDNQFRRGKGQLVGSTCQFPSCKDTWCGVMPLNMGSHTLVGASSGPSVVCKVVGRQAGTWLVERTGAQPGASSVVAHRGGGVGFSQQVTCVDCDHRSLFYLSVPPRALPGYILGPEFLVLSNKERMN